MEFIDVPHKDGSDPNNNTNSSFDGENGESCGIIKIENDIKVFAYGGAGGSGGNGVNASAGGAGGYPGARDWSEAGAGRWSEEITGTELAVILVQKDKIMGTY